MRFNIIIGNPPYQEKIDNNNGNSAKAIYNYFIDKIDNYNTEYISLIIPSRWISDIPNGINLQWLDKMRKREDFINFVDYNDSTEIFENANIAGGVCYFVIKYGYTGQIPSIKYCLNGRTYETREKLSRNGIIIRDIRLRPIVNKVWYIENKVDRHFGMCRNMSQMIYSNRSFALSDEYFNTNWDKYKDAEDEQNYIKYYASSRLNKVDTHDEYREPTGYISELDLAPGTLPLAERFKCFVQYTGPTDGKVINIPFIGGTNSVCSRTYAPIVGEHITNISQAINMIKYFKTKFFRALVYSIKNTQHASRSVYVYVPVQNFSQGTSDINWNTSIKEIDKQLYKKYQLSDEEIELIEELILSVE